MDFDEALWRTVVETVTVRSEREIVFAFKDGTELSWTGQAFFKISNSHMDIS